MTTHNTSALPADISATDPAPASDVQPAGSASNGAASPTDAERGSASEPLPTTDAHEPRDETADAPASIQLSPTNDSAMDAPVAEAGSLPSQSDSSVDRKTPSDHEPSTGDAAVSCEESAQQPLEKTRRRVQLSPTFSPEAARPVPWMPPQAPPTGTEKDTSQGATSQPLPQQPAVLPQQPPAEVTSESSGSAAPAPQVDTADQASAAEAAAPGSSPTSASPVVPAEPVALPPKDEQLDSEIEEQLNAALSSDAEEASSAEAGALVAAVEGDAVPAGTEIRQGARLSGSVQSIHGDDMFIELGHRMAGVLSRRQFGLRRQPMQGESITVIVNRIDENEGLIHVNLPTGSSRVRGNWEELSVDQTVECMVNATNKGGLEVSVGSLRGFMPASQVELGYVADLNTYVGQKLRAQITEVNPKRRKLVLSRRKLLEVEREQTEQEVFQKIAPGQTYEGRVKTIKDYGAFVDIGGVDGLLHVGQISWSRINHPSDVLTEGQQIEVKVLSVDPEKKKIGLGMRQMSQNPWKTAAEKFASGTVATGKVTRIESFGAFIELEPGMEGLVHISELDHQRIKTVHEVLRVGQEVNVQILEVDPSRKRISLSVKALKQKPEEAREPAEAAAPIRRQAPESLKGGIGEPTGGKLFGDPRKFGR